MAVGHKIELNENVKFKEGSEADKQIMRSR
jgi:hypothetical protein